MTIFNTPDVGRVWVPDAEAYTVGPAITTRKHYVGIVSTTHRDASGNPIERGWSHSVPQTEGLIQKWRENDWLQERFRTAGDFIKAVRFNLYTGKQPFGAVNYAHNARIKNGGRMVASKVWGAPSSPTESVGTPTYIALNNNSAFTVAILADQSLGNGSTAVGANVTTNEWTNSPTNVGLSRANGGTPTGYTDPSALDGTFQITVANTFSDTTSGGNTVYGTGLVDANSPTLFNLYAEAPITSATLQIADTLAVTWTIQD